MEEHEYEAAKEAIKKYEDDQNRAAVKPFTCICCKGVQITPGESVNTPLEQDQGIWEGGSVTKVYFGWGSKLDTDSFFVGICDGCMKEAWQEGMALRLYDLKKIYVRKKEK